MYGHMGTCTVGISVIGFPSLVGLQGVDYLPLRLTPYMDVTL